MIFTLKKGKRRISVLCTAHLSLFEGSHIIKKTGENQSIGRVNGVFDTEK